MKRQASTREAMIAATLEGISRDGLAQITLRGIAADAGCSTAGIFLHFAGKDELLEAATARALDEDRAFHAEFAERLDGLALTAENVPEVISSYLELRTRLHVAPVWLELFFNAGQQGSGLPQLADWVDLRQGFWAGLLQRAGLPASRAAILNTYLTMEEAYAIALHDRVEFLLMARETARAFACCYLDPADQRRFGSEVSVFVNERPNQFTEVRTEIDPGSMRERLLAAAVQEILAHGISALNLRRVVKHAETSLSVIAYHFGDTAAFVNEAVWRALITRVPEDVDPYRRDGRRLDSLREWAELIARLIRPDQHDWPLGFYVGSARLIGQAALMARREHGLLPVILHLRRIEGSGTYRASQTIWPEKHRIEHAAAALFGIWIKGQALMNETISRSCPAGVEGVIEAALPLISKP